MHERGGHDCLVGQPAHNFIAQKAVELFLLIYEGGYSWPRHWQWAVVGDLLLVVGRLWALGIGWWLGLVVSGW